MREAAVLKTRQDDALSLVLNRPEQGNALSPDLVEALIEIFESQLETRCVNLTGAGAHFCTGFYLTDIEDLTDGDVLWRILRIEHLLQLVHHASVPVAAFAQGQSVGAGADLFAACAFRIADPNTKFRMPGWNFGLALGTRRLTALIGTDAARDMLIDTKIVSGTQAAETGLATYAAPQTEWDNMASTIVKRAQVLPEQSLSDMLSMTQFDSRDADLASIVKTAGRPGLKSRIIAYRDRVLAARKRKDAS
ncbi:MAG: enoyl-CoA hydratase/isomerase family protein [Paracoccaceae bacterium]